jgi:hypothetical protein
MSEAKPWQDFETLLRLEEEMDTQKEMAEELGCSAPTVSYWLDKAHDQPVEVTDEDLQCIHYGVCGNKTPGVANDICIVCLELKRQDVRDRRVQSSEFDSPDEYIASLREEYVRLKEEMQTTYNELYDEDSEKSE